MLLSALWACVDEAAEGRCHRVWAAELLRRAGWRAVLDGQELLGLDDDGRPLLAAVAYATT